MLQTDLIGRPCTAMCSSGYIKRGVIRAVSIGDGDDRQTTMIAAIELDDPDCNLAVVKLSDVRLVSSGVGRCGIRHHAADCNCGGAGGSR